MKPTTAFRFMNGTGFLNEALGFRTVSATGSKTDTATFYDGPGTNTYNGHFATGSLTVGSLVYSQTGFGFVNIVQSQGSFDQAIDSALTFSLNKVGTWH